MMRGEFSPFFGSNSAQILILRGPTTNGSAPHTRRDGIPHHEGRNPLPTWGLLPFYPKCQYLGHFSAKTRCQRRILHHLSSSAWTILAGGPCKAENEGSFFPDDFSAARQRSLFGMGITSFPSPSCPRTNYNSCFMVSLATYHLSEAGGSTEGGDNSGEHVGNIFSKKKVV